jgi:hypothetical protein
LILAGSRQTLLVHHDLSNSSANNEMTTKYEAPHIFMHPLEETVVLSARKRRRKNNLSALGGIERFRPLTGSLHLHYARTQVEVSLHPG